MIATMTTSKTNHRKPMRHHAPCWRPVKMHPRRGCGKLVFGGPLMSNRLHQSLAEAIAEAPVEPAGSHYEINPLGHPEEKQRQIRNVIAQAKGLRVEINASQATLELCGLGNVKEFDGAAIYPGATEGPGYLRFKLSRRAIRGP
jgi:hypothetical protein